MDETRPICDIETPRKKGNAGIGISVIVVDEPELVANARREARNFLRLRMGIPWIVMVAEHVILLNQSSIIGGGRGRSGSPPLFFLESDPTSIA